MPWMRLLAGFCVVLAAMYSFFFVSSTLSDDTIAPIALLFVYVGFLYWIWARISPRKGFALAIVGVMVLVSLVAFALWFVAYWLSGWSVWVGIVGTLVLGLLGLVIALPGLNVMAQQNESWDAQCAFRVVSHAPSSSRLTIYDFKEEICKSYYNASPILARVSDLR